MMKQIYGANSKNEDVGAYDDESKKGAKALASVMRAAKWPTKLAEHPFGHGAREVYLDESFVFWGAN